MSYDGSAVSLFSVLGEKNTIIARPPWSVKGLRMTFDIMKKPNSITLQDFWDRIVHNIVQSLEKLETAMAIWGICRLDYLVR